MMETFSVPDYDAYPVVRTLDGARIVDGDVEIRWDDGSASALPGVWLREFSPDFGTIHPVTREQVLMLVDLPDDLCAAAAEVLPDGRLAVTWHPEGLVSHYHPGWLWTHRPESPDPAALPKRRLQRGARDPGQILVCHPFNPVYLLPLAEVVASAAAPAPLRDRAVGVLRSIGMHLLVIRKEVAAHVADRLLEAAWRESLWLIRDEVATTAEIDDAIRLGFGLRWAQMGLFETYRIAGGSGGMRHFIAQFGPALQWNWSRLTDVPELTPELVDRIAGQSDRQSGACDVRDLERRRDDNLVAILRALKKNDHGAGSTIARHERGLPPAESGAGRLPVTVARQVPRSSIDYNGHVNEAHYLELAGAGADYIARARSYFAVETHLRHLDEVRAGESVRVTTQLLAGEGSKLHLFHRLENGTGKLAATGEHLLLHVNLQTRCSCPPEPEVAARLARLGARHAGPPYPEGAGRSVGQATAARDQ